MRRTHIPLLLAGLLATVALAGPTTASAASSCPSIRLDQKLKPDKYGLYGAFGIQPHGTSCATGRKVADRWVHDKKAPSGHPWRFLGWACNNRAGNYQQYGVTCTKGRGRITFKAVLPAH